MENRNNICLTCEHYCPSVMLPMCYAKQLKIIHSNDNACEKYEPKFNKQ